MDAWLVLHGFTTSWISSITTLNNVQENPLKLDIMLRTKIEATFNGGLGIKNTKYYWFQVHLPLLLTISP
jgi:hypothetical protein